MRNVVETIHGRYNKYDIVKEDGFGMGLLGNAKFYIYRDGKLHRGSFSDLRDAVEAARQEG